MIQCIQACIWPRIKALDSLCHCCGCWAFMNRGSWDSASFHWLLSLQWASPLAAARHQAVVESSPAARISSTRRCGPSTPASLADFSLVCVYFSKRTRGDVWRFLWQCLIYEGRSQLSLILCEETERHREVRNTFTQWMDVILISAFITWGYF